MASFKDEEEKLFQQTVEWLSSKMKTSPVLIKKQVNGLYIDPFSRTFINEDGKSIYLTAKEFDLLYFLFCHKGQVFTKEHCAQSPNYKPITKKISDIDDHFRELLSSEEYKKFEEIQDLRADIGEIEDVDLFQYAL